MIGHATVTDYKSTGIVSFFDRPIAYDVLDETSENQ